MALDRMTCRDLNHRFVPKHHLHNDQFYSPNLATVSGRKTYLGFGHKFVPMHR
jgi:hypothetical protein